MFVITGVTSMSNENRGQSGDLNKDKRTGAHTREVKEHGLTYDDYAALDDGLRYELNDGVLELMSPAPTPAHQLVVMRIEHLLQSSCGSDYIFFVSPIDVILSRHEVRQPDIVAVRHSRSDIITRRGIEGTPDLVVEVLSSGSLKRDRQQKLRAYANYGIPEYWIVAIEHVSLEQYMLKDGVYGAPIVYMNEDAVESDRMSCAQISMADVLRGLPDLSRIS